MAAPVSTRVLVIDTSFIFFQGICQVLASSQHFQTEWSSSRAQDSAPENMERYELVLIGQSLDARAALVLCRQLCAQNEQTKIILFNQHAENLLFQEDAFWAGAAACLAPSVRPEEFLNAVEQVSCGARLFPEAILAGRFCLVALTKRELEILEEIGDAFCISVNTVRNHAQNILNKLQCNDRDGAVWRARHRGWI